MLLLPRLAIKTALSFIHTNVSTHHLTEKWDRHIKWHSLNILEISTPCLDCTNDIQILNLVLQWSFKKEIYFLLNEWRLLNKIYGEKISSWLLKAYLWHKLQTFGTLGNARNTLRITWESNVTYMWHQCSKD